MSARRDGDFSEGQKALIDDIIARAIADWERKRPRWYEVRKRLDTASALVVASVLVGVGVANLVVNAFADEGDDKENFFREAPNFLLGTDRRISSNVEEWAKAWVGTDDFTTSTRGAIAQIAADPAKYAPSPLTDLVKVALQTNPVMVFRGSTTFGKSQRVTADQSGCHTIVSHLLQLILDVGPGPAGDSRPASDDDALLTFEACNFDAQFIPSAALYLPFVARLNGGDPDLQDTVTLVLQVERLVVKEDGKEVEELTSTLSGLVVEYGSLDPNMRGIGPFPIPHRDIGSRNRFTQDNSGFWRASLNGITKEKVVPTEHDKAYQHYHSITVRLEDERQLRDGEQIIINAFVFVNTRKAG